MSYCEGLLLVRIFVLKNAPYLEMTVDFYRVEIMFFLCNKRKRSFKMLTALSVVILDTVIALIAGVVIFSITFSFDQTPGQGPGLMFVTLPNLFLSIPFGTSLYVTFFGF